MERLVRFKYPKENRSRVYREILTKNTLNPKISLKNYHKYSLAQKSSFVKTVWDNSVQLLNSSNNVSYLLNLYLAYEETKTFSAKKLIEDIIEETLGFSRPSEDDNPESIIDLFKDNGFDMSIFYEIKDYLDIYEALYIAYTSNFMINITGFLDISGKDIPVEIERLVELNKVFKNAHENHLRVDFLNNSYHMAQEIRNNKSLEFPVELVILAEGITEKTLLPVFGERLGLDFSKLGIQVIAAGGKNQVLKFYEDYFEKLNVPILVLLDSDASIIAAEINKIIRPKDRIFVIPDGEFEDILPVELICRALNNHFKLTGSVLIEELTKSQRMTQTLHELWREKGFGQFNKAEFAKIIAENTMDSNDISPTATRMYDLVKKLI